MPGRVATTFEGEVVGSRISRIHWIQEQFDQGCVIRNFTKWEYELRRKENIHHVVQRAFQIASLEPCGPVYLVLPKAVLMEDMVELVMLPEDRYGSVITPQADLDAIAKAAEMLVKVQSPLVITGQSGRNPRSIAALVALAELLGAPVVSEQTLMNFPTTHPLFGGLDSHPYLRKADVILSVDKEVPYVPVHGKPRPDAQIIHIDIDPNKSTFPLWVFPADLLLHADSGKAIPVLVDSVKGLLSNKDQNRIRERRQIIIERHQKNEKMLYRGR